MFEHQHSYYGAAVTETGVSVCYPAAADGTDIRVMRLAQIVYGCANLRSATRSAWAKRVGCHKDGFANVVAQCPVVKVTSTEWHAYAQIRLEPTEPAVTRELAGAALAIWQQWIASDDAQARAKHNDGTMVTTVVPSNPEVADLMKARHAGHYQVSLTQCQAARTTTIYASRMSKAERRTLVDCVDNEPIVEVDISTCAPACWLAYRAAALRTDWLTKLQGTVARGTWYEEIIHGVFGVKASPKLRPWVKTLVATYFSRAWRQGNALYVPDSEGNALQLWPGKPEQHNAAYQHAVKYIQTRWPLFANDLRYQYIKARGVTWRQPYAHIQRVEAAVIRTAIRLYRQHCSLAGITPVISTVYDCILTRRDHAYIAAEALAIAMVQYNVQTSITVNGIKQSWTAVQALGTVTETNAALPKHHKAVQTALNGDIIAKCGHIIAQLKAYNRSLASNEASNRSLANAKGGDGTITMSNIGRGGAISDGPVTTLPSPSWSAKSQRYRWHSKHWCIDVVGRTEHECWLKVLNKLTTRYADQFGRLYTDEI